MSATQRQLIRFDRRIAHAHKRIMAQRARVWELEDLSRRQSAERLLSVLEQSLLVMMQYREILIETSEICGRDPKQETTCRGALREGPAMAMKAWYRHLASANRKIVEARYRITEQKAFISALEQSGRSTQAASALLYRFEDALRAMIADRGIILSHVRTYGVRESWKRSRRGDLE